MGFRSSETKNPFDTTIRERSRKFFETELERYVDVAPPSVQDDERLKDLLTSLAATKNSVFLDIGSGIGYVAASVKELFPDASVCGTDISAKVIKKAKELDHTHTVNFLVANEWNLPFLMRLLTMPCADIRSIIIRIY